MILCKVSKCKHYTTSSPNNCFRLDNVLDCKVLAGEKPSYEELAEALLDVLEGESNWAEIKYITGCSDERCKEISEIYGTVWQMSAENKLGDK